MQLPAGPAKGICAAKEIYGNDLLELQLLTIEWRKSNGINSFSWTIKSWKMANTLIKRTSSCYVDAISAVKE